MGIGRRRRRARPRRRPHPGRARHRARDRLGRGRRPRADRHRPGGRRGPARLRRVRLRALGQPDGRLARAACPSRSGPRSRCSGSTRTSSTTRSGVAGVAGPRPARLRRHQRVAAPGRAARHRDPDGPVAARPGPALLGPVRGVPTLPGGGRGRARPGGRDRPAARGAGPARARRARRGRALAGGDPRAGRVGAVPRRRRHRGAQGDHGQHRDLGPRLARGRAPGARRDVRRDRRATRQPDLDSLVEGVRASGHEVESTVVGRAPAAAARARGRGATGCSRRC